MNTDALRLPVSSPAEELTILGDRASGFERTYRATIKSALALRRKTTFAPSTTAISAKLRHRSRESD